MTDTGDEQTFGQRLIQAAHEALAYKGGELPDARVTRAKVTARRVDVVAPPEYSQGDIRRIRDGLGLSQAVFAELIGASTSTVRAWEQGVREPSEMARRLIALAERDPEIFAKDMVPAGSAND
jgi:putative transcriptional regulator